MEIKHIYREANLFADALAHHGAAGYEASFSTVLKRPKTVTGKMNTYKAVFLLLDFIMYLV